LTESIIKCASFVVPGTKHGVQVDSLVLNNCEHLTVSIECTSFWVSFTKHGGQEDSWVLNDCEHQMRFSLGPRHQKHGAQVKNWVLIDCEH